MVEQLLEKSNEEIQEELDSLINDTIKNVYRDNIFKEEKDYSQEKKVVDKN